MISEYVPTQKGQSGEPEILGTALPNVPLGNYDVPDGWPAPPHFNQPGDVPGPPVQWEEPEDELAEPGYGYVADTTAERDIYYFHSDHLGSTAYLTDRNGEVTQFVVYMPYGETLVDEHTTTYENPFKFSGKELDEITGLYDHGARSRDSRVTMWLNIDPLFEQFADMSPYAYCHGNPIRFSDPTGMFDDESEATNYMKWNGIEGRVQKEGDLYYINDYKHQTSYFRDPSLTADGCPVYGQDVDGVIACPLVAWHQMSKDLSTINTIAGILSSNHGTKTELLNYAAKIDETSRLGGTILLKFSNTASKVLGAGCLVVTSAQLIKGDITYTEAAVDALFTAVSFIGPWGTAASVVYFLGKNVYEGVTGRYLFNKPIIEE